MTIADHIFGRGSRAALATADHGLQRCAHRVLLIKDHSVLKGHRPEHEQNAAFASGASQLPWPKGKHNALPSEAIDVRTWPLPAPRTFAGDPAKMSERELRAEVVRLRAELRDRPLHEEQLYLLGIYKGVGAMIGVPVRTGADWDGDGEIADNSFDDRFHVERAE